MISETTTQPLLVLVVLLSALVFSSDAFLAPKSLQIRKPAPAFVTRSAAGNIDSHRSQQRSSSSSPTLLFMSDAQPPPAQEEMSFEEEVEKEVAEELEKSKKISNLRNENGVEYAPWMNISREDEAAIRKQVAARTAARRKRQIEDQTVAGALLQDSQAQELSGVGINYKVVENEGVELEWATSSEIDTNGFILKRRNQGQAATDFVTLASYENYGPLASKGPDGGVYRYFDENVGVGGWVYRVTESQSSGAENDISQCLVEIQSKEEQQGALIAVGALAVVVIAAVAAGVLLDPVQY